MYQIIKFEEFGGRSASHQIHKSVGQNSFVTVYDYDIKILALFIILLIVKAFVKLLI